MKILIAEDDAVSRTVIRKSVEKIRTTATAEQVAFTETGTYSVNHND